MAESSNENNFGVFFDKFISNVESSIGNTSAYIGSTNPLSRPSKNDSDIYSTGTSHKLDLSHTSLVRCGVIAEALPFWGCYKVIAFDGGAPLMCSLISDSSQSPLGARRIGSLQPHTKVYFISNDNTACGTILGSDPEIMNDVADVLAETITMASGHSVSSESTNTLMSAIDPEFLVNFSNGAPLDSTLVGERGWVCETGTSVFIDPFMAFIKADENCGFWSFHFDQLARMQGHNIQIRAGSYEQEHFDDNGEAVGYVGTTPYSWEGVGAFDLGTPSSKTISARDEQVDRPYLGAADIVSSEEKDDQVPYYRLQTYTGYLGQGFRTTLRLPPDGASGVNKLGGATGESVWEQHLSLDGNYHIRSSQGITIAHSPLYKPPVRKARIENELEGDTRQNYKFSGLSGSGKDHRLSDTPIDAESYPGRSLCADDDTAYAFAWRNEHPFKYHENDFNKIEPPEKEESPSYGQLSGQWYIDPASTVTKTVDHRYKAKYNKLMSYFKILPDGTIVIAGPNGEEIRMVGGSIELSCPGDIQLRPGRNLVSLVGRSTCLRSKHSVDISSSDADVRIKAEKDLFMLAGNGKSEGKLLIENKCPSQQGIVLKSAGQVSTLAEMEVYIRSGSSGASSNIVIDAGGNAAGDIVLSARVTANFMTESRYDFFGSDGNYSGSNVFSNQSTLLGSPTYSTGTMACLGYMACRNHFISTTGHIATALAKDYSGFVGDLSQDVGNGQTAAQKADEELEKIREAEDKVVNMGADAYENAINLPFREAGRIGDANPSGGWGKVAFYFDSTSGYKADGFRIYESRWQQRDRLLGGSAQGWLEKPVPYLGSLTYPWPGYGAWIDPTALRWVDLKFYDLVPNYEIEDNKNPGTEIRNVPDGFYKIIG